MSGRRVGTDLGPSLDEQLERWRHTGAAVAWDDVVGHRAAKRELLVVAEQIRRHSVAERLGLTIVKGVAIFGPPGSGKTMLAKALAAAVERPVYVIPSAEVDAELLRRVYEALASTRCVVVWDEADILLRQRSSHNALGDGRVVAALCSALDGVTPIDGPVTVALTADPEWTLDRSALRAGRLTTKITLQPPRRAERLALWRTFTERVPVVGELDLEQAADRSGGMTGADIEAAVMVALGLSLVEGVDALEQRFLTEALLRQHHVEERPAPSSTQLRHAAIHEAGHAVWATLRWGPRAVASISIRETARSAGRTMLIDDIEDDERNTRHDLRGKIGMGYAGLVAEELVFGVDEVAGGCDSDVRKATRTIRRLMGELAGSPQLGPVSIDTVETGFDSDRGSELMRAQLWQVVAAECRSVKAQVDAVLRANVAAIDHLAALVTAAPDRTLSGPELTDALAELHLPTGGTEERAATAFGAQSPHHVEVD